MKAPVTESLFDKVADFQHGRPWPRRFPVNFPTLLRATASISFYVRTRILFLIKLAEYCIFFLENIWRPKFKNLKFVSIEL